MNTEARVEVDRKAACRYPDLDFRKVSTESSADAALRLADLPGLHTMFCPYFM